MDVEMNVEEALEHFRKGARVAAGSTQTHRGKIEIIIGQTHFHY